MAALSCPLLFGSIRPQPHPPYLRAGNPPLALSLQSHCAHHDSMPPIHPLPLPLSCLQMNEAQWDFGRNWLHHVKAAGIGYYLAVAADVPTSQALSAAGEPCVERIDDEAAKLGGCCRRVAFAIGWHRLT